MSFTELCMCWVHPSANILTADLVAFELERFNSERGQVHSLASRYDVKSLMCFLTNRFLRP